MAQFACISEMKSHTVPAGILRLVVQVTICSMMLVNALFYVALMHVICTIMLHNMGYRVMGQVPEWVQRFIFRS